VFAEQYRDRKWVPWLSYGLATLVGASRLALGRHFPGDVLVGAVLGTSIGRGIAARNGPPQFPPSAAANAACLRLSASALTLFDDRHTLCVAPRGILFCWKAERMTCRKT